MPRGTHPNSRANLIQNQGLSRKEVEKVNSKGGKRSAEVRKELRTFRELDAEYTTNEERIAILQILKERAMKGNLRAFELYRDTTGQKPKDEILQTTCDVVITFEDDPEIDGQ